MLRRRRPFQRSVRSMRNLLQSTTPRRRPRAWLSHACGLDGGFVGSLLRRGYIVPTCRGWFRWELTSLLVLAVVALLTPLDVAFLPWSGVTHAVLAKQGVDAQLLFGINRALDAFLLLDVLFRLHLARPGLRGALVTRRRDILAAYARGWLLLDVLAAVPFDLFGGALGCWPLTSSGDAAPLLPNSPGSTAAAKALWLARLLRLPKVLRLLYAHKTLKQARGNGRGGSGGGNSGGGGGNGGGGKSSPGLRYVRYSVRALLAYVLGVMLAAHWMACLWGLVARCDGPMRPRRGGTAVTSSSSRLATRTDSSWPSRHEAAALGGVGAFDAASAADVYLVSLYWAVMTISTIGYGDIAPTNRAEYSVCIVCMICGASMWAILVGNAAGLVTLLNMHRNAHHQVLAPSCYTALLAP